jgi:TonB family protein
MQTLLRRTTVTFAVAVCLTCSAALPASQESPSKPTQLSATDSYPNTAGGLRALISDLLANAKNDEQSKIWSKIAELEIPDYGNWFTRTYGQEKGQPLATEYGKDLKANEQRFEMLCMELAKQDGEISIIRLDAANRRFPGVNTDSMLSDPTEEFEARWKKTDVTAGPVTQAIGQFCFVNGKYRLKRFPFYEERILSKVKSGPVVPAKLVDRVQPAYPEAARQLNIHGIVSLNVVIHKDGTVTVENVGDGHPLLAPPALAAVQQWKYQPATVGGEPVDIEAKI